MNKFSKELADKIAEQGKILYENLDKKLKNVKF
jgi:hypothetical protein